MDDEDLDPVALGNCEDSGHGPLLGLEGVPSRKVGHASLPIGLEGGSRSGQDRRLLGVDERPGTDRAEPGEQGVESPRIVEAVEGRAGWTGEDLDAGGAGRPEPRQVVEVIGGRPAVQAEIDDGRRPPERDLCLEADAVEDQWWGQGMIEEGGHAADGGARGRLLEVESGREAGLPLVSMGVDGAGQQMELAGIHGRGAGRIQPGTDLGNTSAANTNISSQGAIRKDDDAAADHSLVHDLRRA